MRKYITFKSLLIVTLLTFMVSCREVHKESFGHIYDDYKVQLINCDGTVGREWITKGKPLSRGKYMEFICKKTSNFTRVNGRLIIIKQ